LEVLHLKITYGVQKENQTKQTSLQKTKFKSAICGRQQKPYCFSKAVKYFFLFLDGNAGKVGYTAYFSSRIEVAGSSRQLPRPIIDLLKKIRQKFVIF